MQNENKQECSFQSHKIGDNSPSVVGCEVITKVDSSPINGDKFDDVMPITRYYLNNHENSFLLPTHAEWFMKGVAQTEYELKQAEKYMYETIEKNSSDISIFFLGFLETYKNLSEIIPEKFRILDLGCAFGFQQVFFKRHEQYRGIDTIDCDRRRFNRNAGFEHKDIQQINLSSYNPEERFVIMNAVTTDDVILDEIKKHFKYLFICYPKH